MSYIDGTSQAPASTDENYKTWIEKDKMIFSWINATSSESTLPYVVGATSAKVVWDVLARRYASLTPAHVMSLKRQLHHLKKGNLTMQEYLQQFKTLADKLAICGSPVILTLAVTYGWAIQQLDVKCAFLHGDLQETKMILKLCLLSLRNFATHSR
ncbi:uncharacterized protein LOC120289233 [Eucalyptus grandis]|uniref:uncharacterized protein LOC120289233 n=1 Tax=Eucalyptus grandis TaxID=71139 RepID=UPI00192EE049|nr:uncharacterized protein LOC120289233 [Eucalyptus grandis]